MQHLTKTLLAILVIALGACGSKEHNHDHAHDHEQGHDHEHTGGANETLYNEVMAVHDDVMPKMNDLYKLKQSLKKKIEETPGLDASTKAQIEGSIARIDSASEGMMQWMRSFNPIPDSVNETMAREYLEKEKVKVQEVKDDILEALEEGKARL